MKTLKIAFYDFKRLVFNPITYFGIGIILILTAVLGIFYSPTITPAYSLSYESETSEELFNYFYNYNINYYFIILIFFQFLKIMLPF